MKIRYRANPRKVLEALVWVTSRRAGSGFHFILKTLFYADKFHLQKYGRPVTGDTYVKMAHGPVASLAYDMLKRDDFLPAETLRSIGESLEVNRDTSPHVYAKRDPDTMCFSETDEECLEQALSFCDGLDFNLLSHVTHQEPAWEEADMHGQMDFALFIDQDLPGREELIAYISETSQCLAL